MPLVPDDFVALESAVPGIVVDARYASSDNFTGRPVPGYEAGKLVLTRRAAEALSRALHELRFAGLGLKVFDAYRPQRAVEFFLEWAQAADDQVQKRGYYPNIPKNELFNRGLLVRRSSHSRGSAVDLTIIDARGTELDMGTPFDFFDDSSRPDSNAVSPQQRANRLLLRSIMLQQGFVPLPEEWWHFTLDAEPYPDTCFDFVVV